VESLDRRLADSGELPRPKLKQPRKDGRPAGYPRFKSKKYDTSSFYIANDQFKLGGHVLWVPKLGWVNMAERLRFAGKISGATVSYTGGHWYVAIQVEVESPHHLHEQPSVGLDLGVRKLIATSDKERFENQEALGRHLGKLRRLNKQLSRRQPGSQRWGRTKNKLTRLHAQIRNRRQDAIHKATTEIARKYQMVCTEDLNVEGMVKNKRLARPISDAALGEVGRQLAYKVPFYGGTLTSVGRFFPSTKLCRCGVQNDPGPSETYHCATCGYVADRDFHAAENIEKEGLRLAYESLDNSWPIANRRLARDH
jgi:putative transposase